MFKSVNQSYRSAHDCYQTRKRCDDLAGKVKHRESLEKKEISNRVENEMLVMRPRIVNSIVGRGTAK